MNLWFSAIFFVSSVCFTRSVARRSGVEVSMELDFPSGAVQTVEYWTEAQRRFSEFQEVLASDVEEGGLQSVRKRDRGGCSSAGDQKSHRSPSPPLLLRRPRLPLACLLRPRRGLARRPHSCPGTNPLHPSSSRGHDVMSLIIVSSSHSGRRGAASGLWLASDPPLAELSRRLPASPAIGPRDAQLVSVLGLKLLGFAYVAP